uniref:Protein kinase domain-containing protein n=1 Tax=Angiostrongylus cantonensis TaxID=6313 RepID=A0A0K0D4I0_ANGCA
MGDEESTVVKFVEGKRFGEWVIAKKLDEGGFGHVYKVESNKRPGEVAALKAEPNSVEGGSAIKLEVVVTVLVFCRPVVFLVIAVS